MTAPKPMLCHDGKGQPLPSGPAWMMEPKLDGWRFLFVVEEDGVLSYSGRNGSNRSGQAAQIEECLRFLPPGTILDSELVVLGEKSPKVATALAHPDQWTLHAVVFDILAVGGDDVCGLPWEDRRALLEKAAEGFDGIAVTLSEPTEVSDEQHEQNLALGYEGSVCKRRDSIYVQGKRSRDWPKFKPQLAMDVEIVGFEEGKSGWAGGLGAFVVLLPNGMETTCAIATKQMRAQVTADPESYRGRMIEVHYQYEMDSGLLRHPVFSRYREDLDREGVAA